MSGPPAGRPPRAAVRAAVRDCLSDLEPGDRVLVALSGGPDSLALLAAAVRVCAEQGLLCHAAIVDHQLQLGSAEVAARAAEQARILGCEDVRVVPVEVDRRPGAGGLEAAARTARYDALLRCSGRSVGDSRNEGRDPGPTLSAGAGDTAAILLGHTRDDQAETVLLGLARGSGTRSLAGMSHRSGIFRRPLLDLPRPVVVAAADEAAADDPRLAPWIDPHNEDAAFARVRVRREVLPTIEDALGPGVVEALARTARLARDDADALDAWADRIWQELRQTPPHTPPPSPPPVRLLPQWSKRREATLPIDRLTGLAPHPAPVGAADPLPGAVVSRVIRRFLLDAGCPANALTAEHVWAVTALLERPGTRAEIALPGGLRASRDDHLIVIVRA